ncbi:DUF3043 domain-containing protein [Agilicoccus flavus]|uniref:DUF3043 domain-containing protein n=1 Tax=Agilicoccus flavus TaxID=2775968 RepID=UPI001CF6472B|nr:DUF3043 domain-containing protein [Agilicoccus flavus]
MFRRKKDEVTAATGETPQTHGSHAVRPGAKNRPTPSRREAEAARRRPLVPADRKAAQARSREQEREQRLRLREAMAAGEEWALPARDRGPQRAYIRDYIDARWNVAEFLLPIMIIGLPISLVPNAIAIGYSLVYGALLVAILDVTVLWFGLKKRLRARFGEPERGSLWYVISRAMQIRPGRIPRPRVKRGQFPA